MLTGPADHLALNDFRYAWKEFLFICFHFPPLSGFLFLPFLPFLPFLRLFCQRFQRDDYLRAFCLSVALSLRLYIWPYIPLLSFPAINISPSIAFHNCHTFSTWKLDPDPWHSLSVGHYYFFLLSFFPISAF